MPVPCDDPSRYEVEVVFDQDRKANNIVLVVGGKPRNIVKLPNQSEVNGYALNWAKKTKEGIEISVEYGSRYYFGKRFLFDCKDGEFYLTRFNVESFDKYKPDKWTNKEVRVRPAVPLGDFEITKYLTGK